MQKPELLVPAGNLEKLKIALAYGADAVYLGGERFSLRAGAGNFSSAEMVRGVEYAHQRGKKVYVTVNIFAHNRDLPGIPGYLKELASLGVDGVIISDPGIVAIARELDLGLNLHLSTQANSTNWASVRLWQGLGLKRVVLGREVSLQEIKEIKAKVEIELEAFVHGAMCIAYSGRCLLSSYWTGRSANRGACTHPCRWRYHLVEETRTREYLPIEEDNRGTYILSSRDLNMIRHIPELWTAGLSSWKIEGRMKSVHYVATVTKAYREALDLFCENPSDYEFQSFWEEELQKVTDRGFTTGFYFGDSENGSMIEENAKTKPPVAEFVGIVLEGADGGQNLVEQRNRFALGDWLEVLEPQGTPFIFQLEALFDEQGKKLEAAPHPQQKVLIESPKKLQPNTILRRRLNSLE